MVHEKRRAERISVNLPVSVKLVDKKTGSVLAGPVDGKARNFSPMGLALSLANIPGDTESAIEIPAKPVWYDRDKVTPEKKRALLGVEFLLKPKDRGIKKLVKELAQESESPKSWWQKKIF